jgi:hypothetical protein
MPTPYSLFVRALIGPAALAAWLLISSGAAAADEPAPPEGKSIDGIWQGTLKARK